MALEEKRKRADVVINNAGLVEDMQREVERILNEWGLLNVIK